MTEEEYLDAFREWKKLSKENAELKDENNHLLDVINNQDVKIADLEKKVKYYEQQLSAMEKGVCDVCKVKDADYYEKQKEQAKEIIKTLADDLSMYSGNYQKELLEAEQFLKEIK